MIKLNKDNESGNREQGTGNREQGTGNIFTLFPVSFGSGLNPLYYSLFPLNLIFPSKG
jgi:hypothetical protein